MATENLEDTYWLMGLRAVPGAGVPKYASFNGELGGFIARNAVRSLSARTVQKMDKAYSGCGSAADFKRVRRTATQIPSTRFATGNPGELYQSPFSLDNCSSTTDPNTCGAVYANYQGPAFAPSVWMMVNSSTAVSGSRYPGSGRSQGGIVKAVIRNALASTPFRQYDTFTYCDPNVPGTQPRYAKWVFGDANPNLVAPAGDSSTRHHIFGWVAQRQSSC